jgi:hypothetical protein
MTWGRHFEVFPQRDHPVRSIKGGFAASLLMSRPPLLFKEWSCGLGEKRAVIEVVKKCSLFNIQSSSVIFRRRPRRSIFNKTRSATIFLMAARYRACIRSRSFDGA